jgi:hypothetical protein
MIRRWAGVSQHGRTASSYDVAGRIPALDQPYLDFVRSGRRR